MYEVVDRMKGGGRGEGGEWRGRQVFANVYCEVMVWKSGLCHGIPLILVTCTGMFVLVEYYYGKHTNDVDLTSKLAKRLRLVQLSSPH